ncbi:MAG: choice-of-anchor D domain-containing protein [Deltaproteobacteria bacterium]|nr:choice-of-anchor D domain-containing protein [Deltaproteobacteria bacterium]
MALVLVSCRAEDCTGRLQDTRAQPAVNPLPTLAFGEVDVTQRKMLTVAMSNDGDRDWDELTFTLSPDTDPAFTLMESPPTFVPALGGSRSLQVFVLPRVATQFSGLLTIRGRVAEESAPDPKWEEFKINLTAVAVNNGLPDIEVDPVAVEFGRVAVEDVKRAELRIRNVGIRDLIIEGAELSAEGGGAFGCAECASLRTTLPPSSSVTVHLTFSPPSLQEYAASLTLRSIDPDEQEVVVPLHGTGQVAPVACIEFVDVIETLRPQETVRLDGACSRTEVPGTWLARYDWELSYRTAGSTTVLKNVVPAGSGQMGIALAVECPDPADTAAVPCSTRVDTVADLAGTYEVSLTVTDNTGLRSAPTTVRYRAVPEEALHVQLVWDHPTADLDVHFMTNAGPPFVHATDCYFSNRFPEWFGPNPDPRNPRLDVDDQGGFGPENINVVAPQAGRYRVAVHYWRSKTDGDPATLATVRVYVRGQLALEQGQFFLDDQQMWMVADLDWPVDPEAMPTLNPVGDVTPYPRPF